MSRRHWSREDNRQEGGVDQAPAIENVLLTALTRSPQGGIQPHCSAQKFAKTSFTLSAIFPLRCAPKKCNTRPSRTRDSGVCGSLSRRRIARRGWLARWEQREDTESHPLKAGLGARDTALHNDVGLAALPDRPRQPTHTPHQPEIGPNGSPPPELSGSHVRREQADHQGAYNTDGRGSDETDHERLQPQLLKSS
ncbi:MAG: hypothetical protein ACI8W3_001549 [Myxococcota bacterium]|jgi:hypothetical protein